MRGYVRVAIVRVKKGDGVVAGMASAGESHEGLDAIAEKERTEKLLPIAAEKWGERRRVAILCVRTAFETKFMGELVASSSDCIGAVLSVQIVRAASKKNCLGHG